MNVTFHTLGALATAASLSSKRNDIKSPFRYKRPDASRFVFGAVVGVLMHGLLDYVPHSYPLTPPVDVGLSLALFVGTLFLVHQRHRFLVGACFLGVVLPDVVDLGPAIVNKHLGSSLPVIKICPWHWRQFSGSIYDGSRSAESMLYHLLVVLGSSALLWLYRRQFFRHMGLFGQRI